MKKLLYMLFNILALPGVIHKNWTLFTQLTQRKIFERYRGAFLGVIWSLVQPLMMLAIYTFVFSVVFQARWGVSGGENKGAFAIVMFCGMALYNIFSESVATSTQLIVSNPNFVKKVIFPLEILPCSQVIASFTIGMVWFILLIGGIYFVFNELHMTMLLLPVILIPLLLFTLGVSYFVASLSVYLRDTSYIVGVVLQILFFMTPIFYPVSAVPEKYRWPLQLNPLTILIDELRKIFVYGELPDWKFLLIAFFVSLAVMQLGFCWFQKTKKGFADVL